MKLSYWLALALSSTVLSCGGDEKDPSSDPGSDTDGVSDPAPGTGNAPTKAPSAGDNKKTADGGKTTPNSKKEDKCGSISILAEARKPEILIVLDRSSSMVLGVDRWTPATAAVNKITTDMQETVKFGLMLFPAKDGAAAPGLGDLLGPEIGMFIPTFNCTPGKIEVPSAYNSAANISAALQANPPGTDPLKADSTPTADSLKNALQVLNKPVCPDCQGTSKFVLLVTDGAPRCSMGRNENEASVTATNAAIDALAKAGIKTYVIGYGTTDPESAQALASFAQHGGTEKFLPVEDEASLTAGLANVAGALVACEYELKTDITKPENVSVVIDGIPYKQGEDWHVEGNKIVLEPDAPACTTLRNAEVHDLKIKQECEPPMII